MLAFLFMFSDGFIRNEEYEGAEAELDAFGDVDIDVRDFIHTQKWKFIKVGLLDTSFVYGDEFPLLPSDRI